MALHGTGRATDVASDGDVTASGLTMNTARILGRTTASAGAVEELTVGSGLTLAAGSLTTSSASGGRVLLDSHTFSGSESSWTSGTLATGFRKLEIEIVSQSASGAASDDVVLRFNADATASNYVTQILTSFGASTSSQIKTLETGIMFTVTGDTGPTATAAGQDLFEVLQPEGTTWYKKITGRSVRTIDATTGFRAHVYGGEWRSTAAITTVTMVDPGANNFVVGSTIHIYGVI